MVEQVFPREDWEAGEPGELGFDAEKLAGVGRWQVEAAGEELYRLLVGAGVGRGGD